MKIKKKDQYSKQKINAEIYLKKKKIKRENMEETDTIICLKKETRTKRISKKYREVKKSQSNNQ